MKRLLTTVALLALLVPTLGQAATINLTDADDLVTEVGNANPNDQLILADGTYSLSSTLTINKALTITGNSEADVIIDASGLGSSYGIQVGSHDVTLEYFTLNPPAVAYPIHASGTSNPPDGYDNLTIQYVTIEGTHQRTGFDIHGYNNVVLSHLTSKDATAGNGLQVTGCVGVTIDNFVNENNYWGCIAVYCSNGTSYLGRGSDNVVIDGNTVTTDDPRIFSQDEFGLFNTNVSVTGYDYNVWNDTYRSNAAGFTFFLDTQADAISFALTDPDFVGFESASSIQRISDGHWVVDAGMSIQTAVDDAMAGGTVEVLAGTFVEQVEIAKDLTVLGAGAGVTTVQAYASMPLFFTTSADNVPVIWAHDADVAIHDITVDGAGLGNTNVRFYGIAYRNAGGGVYDCEIKDVRNDPLDGSQHGNAFYLYNNDTVARSMDVQNCDVYGFQKNGITLNALSATPLTVDVSGNEVTGAGVLTADNGDPAQNGIQVYGPLITGSVDGNIIDGIAYDNTNAATKWAATSILDYFTGSDVTNNTVTGGHLGVYKYAAFGAVSGNDLTIEKIGVYAYGIIATDPPGAVPQPFEEASAKSLAPSKALLSVVIDGNTIDFVGVDNTDTYGIDAESGYTADDLDFTATNNTVTGFGVGLDVYQCQSGCDTGVFTSVVANQNNFSGNTIGIRSNVGYLTVDAECNWYGDVSGPFTTTNAGSGDPIQGDVDYSPWLDATSPTGNCTEVGGTAVANPVGEISACNPCLVVPIDFDRTNIEGLRGLSVTFQLSPELELCTGVADIQEATGVGSLFGDVVGANTVFQVIDNGGGSYTADVSLLGLPCGTTTGGTAILVGVTSAAGITTDTTGTITVTGVMARDCDNNPLPGAPGAPASVTINNGAPGVVSDLDAVQDKSGNGSDGTTEINLTWTDPTDSDLATIEIYRKGYGNYPEYDDLGGVEPPAPADATAAAADWTFVASVAAGTGSYTDEPGSRDFWYYVVYANDGCNDGAISNRAGGTLNYHLGDIVPGGGNNIVGTGDISALGTAYGTVDGDTNYNDLADVGPTTDNFVNARPTTDNQIQFEDLLMFAINYGQVSKRPDGLASAGRSDLQLMVPSLPAAGEIFEVSLVMAGDGTVHGVSTDVTWNDARVEYLGFAPGELMNRQGTYAPVFSPKVGRLDAAVFGTERGILGEGTLATLRFKVRESGDAGFEIASIDARNGDNEDASIGSSVVSGVPGASTTAKVTQLLPNIPNPFNPATEIRFVVGQKGPVSVQIYSLQGRLVRTLVQEPMDAGEASLTWHGRDDSGRTVASGTYVVRIDGADRTHTRNIVLLK